MFVVALILMLAGPARPTAPTQRPAAPTPRPAPPQTPPPTFESHWQDGKAELAGYRYHVNRYGEPRVGQAVLITVTEPFSASKRVKVDDPSVRPADTFEAMKLNFVREFQTGIYDYHLMTSTFVRSRDMSPVKVAFSSSEWCGLVYEELRFDPGSVRQTLRSYFEGESADRTLRRPALGVSGDQLFLLIRNLRGVYLRPGERRRVPYLPSASERRLGHRPLEWVNAFIERSAKPAPMRVPAGTFAADRYVVTTDDGRVGDVWVETAYPHRILKWTWGWSPKVEHRTNEPSESAEFLGSARLPYWQLHENGGESYLKALGLKPLP